MLGNPPQMLRGYLAGLLFTVGWFVMIDAAAVVSAQLENPVEITGATWAPGIVTTIGLLLVVLALPSEITADEFTYHNATCVSIKARLFLIVGVLALLGGFAGAIAVHVIYYAQGDKQGIEAYPGGAVIMQSGLILISAVLMRFCRRPGDDGGYESF